jgi:hypothetical protein
VAQYCQCLWSFEGEDRREYNNSSAAGRYGEIKKGLAIELSNV